MVRNRTGRFAHHRAAPCPMRYTRGMSLVGVAPLVWDVYFNPQHAPKETYEERGRVI